MPDRIEQQILDGFRALRDVSPPESASASAVRRAMESVRADRHASSIRLLRPRRWILRGSIAAGIILAAGLVWMSQSAREVSAAELLRQVIETADAYRGWVHFVIEQDGKLSEQVNGVYLGQHINKADGTRVVVTSPGLRITMDSPSRKETAEYDSRTKEIRLGDMIPYNVGSVQRATERMPIDLGSQITSFRYSTGREPHEITRNRDGEYERIQIRFFKTTDEASVALQQIASQGRLPVDMTIWVDPRTKLTQRGTFTYVDRCADGIRPGGPSNFRVFYGQPITDIYAAGAPRDAVVKDFRVTSKAKAIWTRLEKRHEEAYGDGMAVVTTTEFLPDGRLDPNHGTVAIYLRQGAARFFADYYVSCKPSRQGRPRIPPFADWPTPDLQEVLRRARLASPGMIFVTDGSRAWGGDADFDMARWLDPKDMVWWDGEMGYSVSSRIWPTRRGMWLYGTSTSADMSRDSDHSDWLLIHVRLPKAGPGEKTESGLSREMLHWLDTSRDDMPVRRITRHYAKDGKTVEREYEYLFEDWAQLDNGQWYPTRWRQVSRVNKEGTLAIENTFENRLRIYPGAAIDSQWFTMPPVFPSAASGPSAGNGS